MGKRGRLFLIFFVVGLLAGVASIVGSSNYARKDARATFHKGQNGQNELHLRGPAGATYVVYDVAASIGSRLDIVGSSSGKLPVFGATILAANYYPEAGKVDPIELDQHVKLSELPSPAGIGRLPEGGEKEKVGLWLVVTKDAALVERLRTGSPAPEKK